MNGVARWKHWDMVALVAGAVPLILILLGAYAGVDVTVGFSGYLIIGAVLLYLMGAALAWRQGDGRLIAGGCAMLMIPAVLSIPLIILAIACLNGNCL
ncbi:MULTISPECIES: hypothetical protein [unclassified Sphingopyxis]|uniref:hypothetical protein n=2 Tax=unclassified Sphingopyxis TaxID=2614943 RepID=UPI00073B85DF|nr:MULTISPECIES: hypothetical protein [unclassified Sphingopyxis]KTE49793.1 hypothetical protein ATE69_19695 [Sphingopyxis sp. H071]